MLGGITHFVDSHTVLGYVAEKQPDCCTGVLNITPFHAGKFICVAELVVKND
jgi:hypothetical protein